MVWSVGFANWTPAKNVPELTDLLAQLPPAIPTKPLPPMPKTWLVESILATCFCCLPLGIVGIINAAKVSTYYAQHNYVAAQQASSTARQWTLISITIGFIIGFIYTIAMCINAMGDCC